MGNLFVGWRLRKNSGYRRFLFGFGFWCGFPERCCTGLICFRYELSCLVVFSTNVMSTLSETSTMGIGVFYGQPGFLPGCVFYRWYKQCIRRFTYNLLLLSVRHRFVFLTFLSECYNFWLPAFSFSARFLSYDTYFPHFFIHAWFTI